MLIGVAPAFALTSMLVNGARTRRQALAGTWAERGAQDLADHRSDAAADDFRTAMEYAPDRNVYRRQLAEALVAADRSTEARSQLLTLWSATPGDGPVNLDLARLAARDGNVNDAIRYYHAAIDGAWQQDAPVARRTARVELARFLLDRGAQTQAQAELIALAGDLPPDPELLTDAAALLVKAGAAGRAVAILQRALELNPSNARALRLAGEASFKGGDYRAARSFLERLKARGPIDPEGSRMLDLSARVLALDPFSRDISSRERIRRVMRAYDIAADALDRCSAGELDGLRDAMRADQSSMTERKLAADPDAVDHITMLVGQVEDAVGQRCGPGSADDAALHLILAERRSPP